MTRWRPRVLAAAYACAPDAGSEAGIGWNMARQLARFADVTLVTRRNNVAAVQAAVRAAGLSMDVHGYELSPLALRLKAGPRFAMPYAYAWHRSLGRWAQRTFGARGFDASQHLTFASPWIPSGLAELDAPFVLGPVGQHPRVPARFLRGLGERASEAGRALVRRAAPRFDPAVQYTWGRAAVILSLGSEFERWLPAQHKYKLRRLWAAGIEPSQLPQERFQRRASGQALAVVFAGRLVPLKGARLALEAFECLVRAKPGSSLTFVGDGPLRRELEVRAAPLGAAVTFTGRLPHAEALMRLQTADVFLFPSFEGGGMVVPEAFNAGCPVVTLQHGGPGEMVGEHGLDDPEARGLVVSSAGRPSDVSAALASALLRLAEDEGLRSRLARQAARFAAASASWDSKGVVLEALYRGLVRGVAEERPRGVAA